MSEEEIERAAIIEYEANMPREEAEILAALGDNSPRPWPARCQCEACVKSGRATVLG